MDSIASIPNTGDYPLLICREEVDQSTPMLEELRYRNNDNDLTKRSRYVALSHICMWILTKESCTYALEYVFKLIKKR